MNATAVLGRMGHRLDVDFVVVDKGGPVVEWLAGVELVSMQEIEAAWPAVQVALAAEAAARKTADDQQSAGIVEAKRAYARMQTIIDGADTATTAQIRAAIKIMAQDMQHLIRAAVR